jgi:carbon storage regulator
MLVLSRKEGERIRIGENVFVTVVHVSKDKVRIGVEAPLDMIILRDELQLKIPVVKEAGNTTNKTENNSNTTEQYDQNNEANQDNNANQTTNIKLAS